MALVEFFVCFLGGGVIILLLCLQKVLFYLIQNLLLCFKLLILQAEGGSQLRSEVKVLLFDFTEELNLEYHTHTPPPFLCLRKSTSKSGQM